PGPPPGALVRKLRALAVARPEACQRLGERLVGAPADGAAFVTLIEALEWAGHADAQAALVAPIAARTADWPALARLLPALGSAARPTAEAVRTLESLAFGSADRTVATAALLALGNQARSLAEESPERSDALADRLLNELRSHPADDATWRLILALG